MYNIMLCAKSESFASSFTTWIPFIYISSIIDVVRTSKIMLNYSGGSCQAHAWDFLGNNTGVGYHFFPRGTFPTQALNRH